MEEIWKEVPCYEGILMVSSKGRIKSLKRDKVSEDRIIGKSLVGRTPVFYLAVSIKRKTLLIHRIVATAFIPNPDNKPEVGHKDNNSFNNSIDNLEWVTHSENQRNSISSFSLAKRGEKHPRSLLSDMDVLKIIEMRANKVRYKKISEIYNVSENTLCSIVTRSRKYLKLL